jgi:hypothetical protein
MVSAAAVGLLAVPNPAGAVLCLERPPLEQAIERNAVVFVGTVETLRNVARFATVRVHEQWKGAALPDTVEVRGTDVDDPTAGTSGDRSYDLGSRYLFVPANSMPPFLDGLCSATTPWSAELAQLRPGAAPGASGHGASSSGRLILASLAVLAAGAAWLSWNELKRQRPRPRA